MKLYKTFVIAIALSCNISSFAYNKHYKRSVTIDFSIATSQQFINPPYISGVINDPTDPAATTGIRLDINENSLPILAANYSIAVTSSKTAVVPLANITIFKFDGYAIAKILPASVGYSDIKLTLTKGSSTDNITIKYAASAASATPSSTFFHTGMADASAAIALDTNYMLIGDDEINSLFVFDRKKSGLPVATYDYQNLLGLTDGSTNDYKEIDLEAGVKSPTINNRIYWISSLGTAGSSSVVKPNINRLFATDVAGTGSATSIATVGYYNNIRNSIITWGNNMGYNFTASAASGKDSKSIDGFNVEGMCFAPDNTTLYIGLRAPLVPISNRNKAVIVPITNFETWFNNGTATTTPTFANAIELNLGGRGVRDIIRLSNGVYIIAAGNYDNLPLNGALYKWTGVAADAPVLISQLPINTLNTETLVEIVENGQLATNKLEVISDNGSTEFYNDGTEAKDLSRNNYKKFRSDIVSTTTNVLPLKFTNYELRITNGTSNEKQVTNLWTTANEINVSHFNIQRSSNGKDFITIGKVTANNKVLNEYSFIDNKLPLTNDQLTLYYRLTGVDKDGKTNYSETKLLTINNKLSTINIYPNPANSIVTVECSNAKELLIVDYSGKIIYTDKTNRTSYIVNLKPFAKGVYIVKAILNNGVIKTEKLIVE